MYGGAELAWAAVIGWHALDEDHHSRGLIIGGTAVGALGAARLVSLLLTSFTGLSIFLVIAELATAAVCFWLGWQE